MNFKKVLHFNLLLILIVAPANAFGQDRPTPEPAPVIELPEPVIEEEVTPEASFVEDLGADSLDTVELVMALEEEFSCEIPDEEAEKITTVQEAINYITTHSD